MRDLARDAYPVEVVRTEIVLLSRSVHKTVWWEARKARIADVDAALQAAVEINFFLEKNGLNLQTSDVENISTETTVYTLAELVRSLRKEIYDIVALSTRTERSASQNNHRNRSYSQNTLYRPHSSEPRHNNNLFKLKQLNQPNGRNTAQNRNNQRNSSKVSFSDKSNNSKRD